jgi:hypothetical protein
MCATLMKRRSTERGEEPDTMAFLSIERAAFALLPSVLFVVCCPQLGLLGKD